ncbi:uncharacterized protein LOC121771246 isoform X2 [Salvia splendens]|uniref:uncharacterized protein LOC121771246 isoform X2 n=1 Tax=Salvia splendens TaxID=180675 RepID=UPI001C27CF9E|nr:uncharacterized protein LOC121771246 isoform X2 [Salvia splendens]XP_042023962.1 uncharacterized protein LOC121771246 isoform X2 [Salvia splendens]
MLLKMVIERGIEKLARARVCRLHPHQARLFPPPLLVNAAAACVKCIESDHFIAAPTTAPSSFPSSSTSPPASASDSSTTTASPSSVESPRSPTPSAGAPGDLIGPVLPPPMHLLYNPYPGLEAHGMVVPPHLPPLQAPANVMGLPQLHVPDAAGVFPSKAARGVFPPFDVAAQRLIVGHELGNLVAKNLNFSDSKVEKEVLPDDRTIFLTFSKGYPTTEEEVREYFTRRFGDFIEDVIMQEVEADEQPLYAKMVAKSAAVIDGIVEGNKAKYSINGKHVWARKYVKKPPQQRSPPRGEASGSGSSPTLPKKLA